MQERNKIENASNFNAAIEVISKSACELGIFALEFEFAEKFGERLNDVVVVPVLKGGGRIGGEIATRFTNVEVSIMQMSYYDSKNERLSEPVCKIQPDISKIIVDGKVRKVIFTEGVVDSEGTIKKSMEIINKLIDVYNLQFGTNHDYPEYHTFALVSKVNGDSSIPNLVYPFIVDNRIWVHGWGVDNGQMGREEDRIMGVLSPLAETIPEEPYVQESSLFLKYFKKSNQSLDTSPEDD